MSYGWRGGPPRSGPGSVTAGLSVCMMFAMTWLDRIWNAVHSHVSYYVWFVADQWDHMTPVKYTSLLVSIGLIGFLLMGRGNKRT